MAQLRILCLGDSLTEGYSQFGLRYTPYSATLKANLNANFLGKKLSAGGQEGGEGKKLQRPSEVEIVTDGVSGDLLTMGMFISRMGRRYEQTSTRRPLYDWVVILGGTNDLGYQRRVLDIYDALTTVSNIPLENEAKVLLCTVPECGVKSESLDRKRNDLNKFIRSDTRENVHIFDLHAKIPYHTMEESERNEIWDDGLHFTSKGYERMGEMIAERLIEIIDSEAEAEEESDVAE